MDDDRIELILGNVKMSMEMEGFEIDEELEKVGRQIVTGELDVEECVEQVKRKYMNNVRVMTC